jgi:hypothetical protein
MEHMSLNESIIKVRVELQNSKLKKTGKNKFAGFEYYELSDFLPKLNELMLKNGMNDQVTIGKEYAELTLIKGDEKQTYTIPFVMFETPKNKNGMDSMQHIQYLGALNTYYKRYLYLNAFGITDGEVIDSMNNNEITNKKVDNMSSIINLIKTKKVNEDDFLKYFGVDRVGALTYDQQQQALVMLQKK